MKGVTIVKIHIDAPTTLSMARTKNSRLSVKIITKNAFLLLGATTQRLLISATMEVVPKISFLAIRTRIKKSIRASNAKIRNIKNAEMDFAEILVNF